MKFPLWVLGLCLLLTAGTSINAQQTKYLHLELENTTSFSPSTWASPQLNLFGSSTLGDSRWGTYLFALVKPEWGQAYGGLSYQLLPWLKLNAGLGIETNEKPLRLNWGAFIIHNKLSIQQIYEYGGSGFWYYVSGFYQTRTNLWLGAVGKRYLGWGPSLAFNLGKTAWSLQLAPTYDFEFQQANFMTLLRYQL